MLEWDDLRHFLAIARHGTLSSAARALGVQQSTMGRRLEAIEHRAGARLLQRTPAGFVPTAAGDAILANVERIEAEALAIERAISGKDVRLEGTITMTAVEDFAVEILTPILAAFREKYPGIALELITGQQLLSLTRGEADVALRFTPFTQQELAVRKLADVAFAAYAGRAYLDRLGMPDFAAGAPGHMMLAVPEEQMASPKMAWFTDYMRQASVAFRCNSFYLLAAAAKANLGIAALPRYLGDAAKLVRLDTPENPPLRQLWMGVHRDLKRTPRIRALTDFLAAGIKQAAALNPP